MADASPGILQRLTELVRRYNTPMTPEELAAVPPARRIQDWNDPANPAHKYRHGGSLITGAIDSLFSGAALPGDVYQGKVDPTSEEGTGRVLDLAGSVMGGGFASAPRAAAGEAVLGTSGSNARKARALAAGTPELPPTAAADSAEGAAMAAQRARFGEVPAAEGWKKPFAVLPGEEPGPLYHPISKVRMGQPLDDLRIIYGEPHSNVAAPKPAKPTDMEGGLLVGIGGDPSSTGKTILGIGDNQFANPVKTQGGSYFSLAPENEGAAWASQQGIANRVQGYLHKLGKANPDTPIHLGYNTMTPTSVDYNHMTTETIRELMRNAPVSKKDIDTFNLVAAAKIDPNFPGIDKLNDEWIAKAGTNRTLLAQMLDTVRRREAGFPDMAAVRMAQTDPNLHNAPWGTGGYMFAEADPSIARLARGGSKHGSYDTLIPKKAGTDPTQFEGPVPYQIMYPDWYNSLRPGMDYSHVQAAFRTQLPTQKMTSKWADTVSRYLEQQRRER